MTQKQKPATSAAPAAAAPSTPAPQRDPEGALFGRNVEADEPAPIIERAFLAPGAIVKHKGSRTVMVSGRSSMVHSFKLLGAPAGTPWFSLWGSANLNSQLRKVKPGSTLLLRYVGQQRNDDDSPGAHQWEVKPSTVSDNMLGQYLQRPERVHLIRELATVCERALTDDRERRKAQQNDNPAGPPHDDDDLPF